MKVVSIIEARYKSSRLPGKVLLPIMGRPMMELMVERVKRARTIDQVVIATTDQQSDNGIVELSYRLGVGVFRGSEEDVLGRVVGAARKFDADIIVELTGDCPLNDPAIIDKVVSDFLIGGADFVSNTLKYSTPRGTDVRVFKTNSLEKINDTSIDPADHEHVSLHFWEHPEKYRLRNVITEIEPEIANLRLTVDTQEDFDLVSQIFNAIYPENREFNLFDILYLLQREPELQLINQHIHQKPIR